VLHALAVRQVVEHSPPVFIDFGQRHLEDLGGRFVLLADLRLAQPVEQQTESS
jgi:hypothetical protein